jgi:hypothetical protein
MILLCGIPSEPSLERVCDQLVALGAPHVVFNQRRFGSMAFDYAIAGGRLSGAMRVDGRRYRLEDIRAVYTRLMDEQFLPELQDEPEESPLRRRARALHEALTCWCEITPARVVNRAGAMGSNFSKPYQAQLIRAQGLLVPETLVTNDPELVLAFRDRHKRLVYKSISGIRSIVQTLEEEDLRRLDRIRWCPTQFQQYVDGTNIRVHTIGSAVFATAIRTQATDYRYAQRQEGEPAALEAMTLSDELAQRCVRLADALGLAFAGIDLKVTPEGQVYCFEVNPSPAYSYYEAHTGQPIARAVACYLADAAADG